MRKPRNQSEALERLDAVTVALWIDRGWMDHSPLELSKEGRRRLKTARRMRASEATASIA